jgi:DNA polymerase III epsilon subunit-like protein
MKDAYIDVETGGFYFEKHAITQFGMVLEINGTIKEEIELLVKPFPGDEITPEALEVSGLTLDKIRSEGMEPIEAFTKIIQTLDIYADKFDKKDKFNFYGWNGRFDGNFVREFFKKNNSSFFGSYFWTPPLDLMAICMRMLKEEREHIASAKLHDVAKYLKIDLKKYKLHSALDDARLMMEVEDLVDIRYKEKLLSEIDNSRKLDS